MNNNQLNLLESLGFCSKNKLKSIEQTHNELKVAWLALREGYEGMGADEAEIYFQLLTNQFLEYQHTLERLTQQASRVKDEAKEVNHAT